MKTKFLVEGLLYMNPALEIFFRAAHIINDTDRKWQPVAHEEIGFIHKFQNPKFLVIIDNQIHVFLFGDPYVDEFGKERGFHVFVIDGYNCKHTALDKKKLIEEIKFLVNQEKFLPEEYMNRIIYMDNNEVYIFNKIGGKKLFSKSTWSIGTDIYSVDALTYETSADEIIKECYKHIEEL